MAGSTIIWDWSGTLLNDVDLSVNCINKLLFNHNLKLIDKSEYLHSYTYPYNIFFKKLGFNINNKNYDKILNEYNIEYTNNINKSNLFPPVNMMLKYFNTRKFNQIILTDMPKKIVKRQLERFDIYDYFTDIKKTEEIEYSNYGVTNAILIGDTIYDYNLSKEIGINITLINNGHQNLKDVNIPTNITILNQLDVLDLIPSVSYIS